MISTGRSYHAGVLFVHAKRNADRVPENGSHLQRSDALTAIVFAAAALEAFLTEAVEYAQRNLSLDATDEQPVRIWADCMMHVDRAPLTSRLLVTKWLLSGKPFDRSRQPYQDLELLIAVRNALLHSKPENLWYDAETDELTVDPGAIAARLRSRNLVPDDSNLKRPWMTYIETRNAAQWACHTAIQIMEAIVDAAPSGDFKEAWQFFLEGVRD